ncbi:MAG TPA: hypothetical protein VFE60_21140 [Roseiarcus sp.]|nr:hypothetical protein [Roseiarcus sp.]
MRSGLPDTMVIFRQRPVFVEVKSQAGIASKGQKRVGRNWWRLALSGGWRGARALRISGVEFRWPWKPPELRAWEGLFDDPNKRLPQAEVAAHRREVT